MPKFNVKKTVQIEAPVDKVYAIVRDFKQWPTWSPWLIMEPECVPDYSEHGRSYSWDGKIVGAGEMGIVSEQEGRSIDYRLVFLKPWKSVASVRFEFESKDGGTQAIWSMEGSLPFFMFFMKNMMAAFVGMDYERGLKMLEDYAETGSVPSKLEFVGRETIKGFQYVGSKSGCSTDEIADAMEKAMGKVKAYMKEAGIEPAGKPFSIYHKFDPVKRIAIFTAGYPIASIPGNLPSDITFGRQNDCEGTRRNIPVLIAISATSGRRAWPTLGPRCSARTSALPASRPTPMSRARRTRTISSRRCICRRSEGSPSGSFAD